MFHDAGWEQYVRSAVKNFRLVHEGSRQVWMAVASQSLTVEEADYKFKQFSEQFQEMIVDQTNNLFNNLQMGLAERCLAVVILLNMYGTLVDTVEEQLSAEEREKQYREPLSVPVGSRMKQ